MPVSTASDARRNAGLRDRFGRRVTYLRVSVTDRCDFRCVYCMSEKMRFLPKAQILTLEEILRTARAFVESGVGKIRITGGEPLVRRNVLWLLEEIGRIPQLRELVITTNGSQLARMAGDVRRSGVRRINISLDSLQPERFRRMTRNGDLDRVLAGIDAAIAAGFERVKLNVVVLKNRNHDEVTDLVQFAVDRGIDISFIEEMPLGAVSDHDRLEVFYPSHQIRSDLAPRFSLVPTTKSSGGPARYYQVASSATNVGFISPHSHNFCDSCNRVRLTAEGRLLLCLGQEHSVDLRRVLRAHPDDDRRLKQAIVKAMDIKPRGHDFDLNEKPILLRHMNMTGG